MAVSAPAPSIPPGEHVQLSLPHVGLLPATVSAVNGGTVVLVLAVKDSRVHRLAGQEVAIEHKTGRGIHILDNYSPLRLIKPETLRQDVVVFPVKDALMYIQSQPLGGRGKSFQ